MTERSSSVHPPAVTDIVISSSVYISKRMGVTLVLRCKQKGLICQLCVAQARNETATAGAPFLPLQTQTIEILQVFRGRLVVACGAR